MRITKINVNPILTFQGRKNKQIFLPNGMLSANDTFERAEAQKNIFTPTKESVAEKYLNSLGNQEKQLQETGKFTPVKVPFGVDKEALKNADKINAKTIKNINSYILKLAKQSVYLANITEEMFDEEYGKDNWVFVSIGTSPAGIAKALEIKGHDVRYVPITNLRRINDISVLFEAKGKDDYKNYLDKIGLNKNAILKDKRDFVVCDYTALGTTLENIKFIATQKLGIQSGNVGYYSINNALLNYANNNPEKADYDEIKDIIEKHMCLGAIGVISGVPHLPYKNLENIYLLLMEGKSFTDEAFETALAYYIKNEN